jgi:plasmid stability protein
VATLYVRDVPDELQHRLRVCAAMGDETMKSLILRALERECDRIEASTRRTRRGDTHGGG